MQQLTNHVMEEKLKTFYQQAIGIVKDALSLMKINH